ncbi:MAG: putative Ig domain-containing protein [Saprospiraceae bacterium]|nr:putative Ig domain-containing protein [Saprospiraceae bacterium]
MAAGDAFAGVNSQKNAFQFPVNVSTATGPFTVLGQINGPFFNDQAPLDFASHGIFIGTGDQQNYLKVTVRNNDGSSAFQVLLENNGLTSSQLVDVAGILDASTIIIYISVDPATGEVQASYSADGGTRTDIGTPVTLTGDLLAAVQGTYTINGQPSALAAGPIATSTGAAPEFSASWDYFEVTQNPSDAQAKIEVNTGGINGSTFGNSSFFIENLSTGSAITKVIIDLSTTIIPEVVFDPNGTAGDATSKDLTLNGGSDGGTGYTSHTFGKAYEGGFYSLEVNFNDFTSGETIEFGLDIDPVSIKGGSSPGPNESGSVSGLEISGARAIVTFDTGEEWEVELMSGETDSEGDSKSIARNALPDAPTISIDNVTSQSVVVTPNHTVTVTGPVGGEVLLLQLEAGLFLDGLNGPNAPDGYDIDPWEVNSVIVVTKLTGTISNSFTADFNVTLTDSDDEAGYNIFAAVIVDDDGATSDLSNIIIVEYDPDAAPQEEIRINAGGPTYTDGQGKEWAADNFFVNGQTFTNATAIANTDDDELYQTERYNANLQYEIPVAGTGPYQVNLHFAELYFGLPGGGSAGGAGSRVFDIVIEGENKLLNFDIFAEVGAAAATIKTFSNIIVSDGTLNISFPASANNGKISAIEVLGFGSTGDIPINLSQIADQISVEGVPAPFDIVATGGDGNLLYSASGLPSGLSVEPTNGDIIGTIAVGASAGGPNNDGIYNVTVSVDDSDGETNDLVSTSFTWTVLEPSQTQALFRVNAGGGQLAAADASSPVWSADTGSFGAAGNSPYLIAATTTGGTFTGNSGSAHPGPIITTDPSLAAFPEIPTAVFNTERWDGPGAPEMLWQFPVPQGTEVEIAILFAELFQDITEAGQRVFDISIDGVIPPVFDDIDAYAVAGPKGAFVRTFTTTSDGTIDIELIHGVENPAIKGIQISTVATSDNDPPVVVNPGTQSGVEGNAVSLQISATDTDPCDGLTYAATGLPPSLSIDENTGLITGTLDEGTGSGVAGAFIEDEGVLIIEAETDFVNTPDGWEPFSQTGTQFLIATDNNFGNATGGEVLTYDIQINTPGLYRFHMKSDISGSNTTEENDTWFKIDNTADVHFFCSKDGAVASTAAFLQEIANFDINNPTYFYPAGNAAGRPDHGNENPGNKGYFKVYRSGGGGNKWNTNTIDNNGFPIYAYFANAGNYTINMSERSAGHKVDRFALIHVDDVDDGVPTATLNGAESEQAVGGTAGAADGSPYNVTVTVTDACDPPAFSSVNFAWVISETQQTGNPSALVEITPGGNLGASTFGGSSIQLTNTSTGNLQITSFTLDLSTGILPDMVFDPVGAGGDDVASCFTANSGAAATGLIAPADPCSSPFSGPRNGGFDVMSISFSDFDPNEALFHTVDIDPNSIQGVPGAGAAGSVSGYELTGATVTITFSDGTTLVSSIYEDGSLGGGQAIVAENAPATPSITAVGQDDITCVESANQTIQVSGPAGAHVSLLLMDSRLFIQSGNPPFNVPDETFYANEAMSGKTLYTAVIGNDGTVEIPVSLLETPGPGSTTNGGLNHIVAVLSDGPYAVDQQVSRTSNVLILKLDPACAGTGADLTLTVSNEGRTSSDNTGFAGDYTVNLFSMTDAQTPVASYTTTADAAGSMTITDITPGTYQVAVKRAGFLQRVQVITLTEGANSATIAELLAGDANGDNSVGLEDFSLLSGVFNTTNVNPESPTNYVDFNGDGSTGLEDFSLLSGNFNVEGEQPVEQP